MEMEEHAEEYETSLKRVQESLQAYPELEIKILPGSTHTAELAAQALGTTPGQIAKTLCFLADGKPILIVACGDKKIDTKKWGRAIEAKKIKMADAETVMQITGFAPGGVCPFALRQQVSVYLDNSLKEYDITFIAAGAFGKKILYKLTLPIGAQEVGITATVTGWDAEDPVTPTVD